uniref:Cytochrome P450 n=1 Tax=Plectus sambesii TaxID=2011161 RepID=A0A914XKE2_9BILA
MELGFIIVVVIIFWGVLAWGFILYSHFYGKKNALTIPGAVASNLFLGNLHDIITGGGLAKYLAKLHAKHGPVVSFWWESTQVVSTYTADAFKKQSHWFNRPEFLFANLIPLIGEKSIQITNGSKGKRLRSYLDNSFTHKAVEGYIPTLLDIGQEIVDSWDKYLDGEKVPARESLMGAALKATAQTSFGDYFSDNAACRHFNELYGKTWDEAESMLTEPKKRYSDEFSDCVEKMRAITNKIALDRKINPPTDGGRMLIDEIIDVADSDEEINDLCLTYIVAGYHNSGNLLTWMTYLLARYPDIQERVYDELVTVLGKSEPFYDYKANDLKLLKHVIDETLRVSSLASFAARYADEEVEIGGHKIPAGTPVVQALNCSYENEEVFPNAQSFDPDRFDRDHIGILDFCPFGFAGKRQCPGQ